MRFPKAIYSAIYTVHSIACHIERLHRISPLTFSPRISPEFHQAQNKNEPHLCNSLIFSVAGAGIEPATS